MSTKISEFTTTGSAPGDAYLPLAYNGANYKINAASIGGGTSNSAGTSLIVGDYEVITSSTVWTAPESTDLIWLTLIGGGGGGGAGYINGGNGAGGGGSSAMYNYYVNVSGGHDYTITIGAGGAGATAGGLNNVQNGTAGSDSVFEKTTDASYIITCGGGATNSSATAGAGGTLTTGANLVPTGMDYLPSAPTPQYSNGAVMLVGGDGSAGTNGHFDNGRSQGGNGGEGAFPLTIAINAGLSTAGAMEADSQGVNPWNGLGRYPNAADRGTAINWGGEGETNAAWAGFLGAGGGALINAYNPSWNYGGDGIALIRTISNEE